MIVGLHGYLKSTGSKFLLLMEGKTLRYLNTTNWDPLDTGFSEDTLTWMETCPLNDKVYIANGTDNLHSWDGGATTLNSSLTELGSSVPTGKVLRWHKNHMFMANTVKVSGQTYYHRLYWSEMGNPDTWDTANDFINVPGDGNLITLGDLGNSLVLFKEYSIQFLSGWGDSNWRITASSSNTTNLDEKVGTLSPRGLTRVGDELWFMDNEGQIRRLYRTDFDAFRRDIISTKIQGTLDTINKNQLSKVVATTWNDKVYFAIPTGSSTVNDTVLVFDLLASKRTGEEAWTVYTGWKSGYFETYPSSTTPDLYVADAEQLRVYQHSGSSDDGVAIDSRWDGREDDFDRPERWKRYKFGYISGPSSGSVKVEVHASIDGASFADLGDLDLSSSGAKLGPTGTFKLGPTGDAKLGGTENREFKFYFSSGGGAVRGKKAKMSIRHNVVNESPTVEGFTVHYKERSLR